MALGNGKLTAADDAIAATAVDRPKIVDDAANCDEADLMQNGGDCNATFLRSVRAGDLSTVCNYLDSGQVSSLNVSNANGLTALHLAAKDGSVPILMELLKRGADINIKTKKDNTALHIAALSGQVDIVRALLDNGASVNMQSHNGFTPLYMAAQENHHNCVRLLLEHGASQTISTQDGFTPLAVAMQQGHEKVVDLLLENDNRGKVRLPALHIAAKKDDVKAANLLLEHENNPDITSKSGFTPLHIAAHYGNDKIASLLYERGANVNFAAKHNITPLHVASKWGKLNMVSLLISKGADIQSKTRDGLTPLHCAARSGHDQVVDLMLENGAPIQSKTKNGLAPLHMATQGEHVDAARILLYHGAIVDEVTVDYLTALHVAAHCGHVRVAKLLLDRQADPNSRALNGFTPLHIACKKNRLKMVELLLKHGANITATTESGLTPLHVASFMGCVNIVVFLLQNDARPNSATSRGETPLHLAARANQADIVRILLRNNAQVDARAREDQTPLHVASRLGNVDVVAILLQNGAEPQSVTKDLYTPLHIAAKEGQEEVASLLLDHKADPSLATKKGFTSLHLAAKYGHLNVCRLLLQKNTPTDIAGKNGVTPLHVATHYDHQPIALLLLNNGASPNLPAKNGHTPLHIAARKNQIEIATTLLEYGAKVDAESKAGFIPIHLSAQRGFSDMTSLLIANKSDVNHCSKNGLTPLHLCAQEDYANVAKLLLASGADRNAPTKTGYTPLHIASHYGAQTIVKLLLEQGADVNQCTNFGYSPLHQAAQQGHITIIRLLLKSKADPNLVTKNGQTAFNIADKLGYVTIAESLKVVTETTIVTTTTIHIDEKYKVVGPETMHETYLSDSEDEGGDEGHIDHNQYQYMASDDMKSFGGDSLRFDVRTDENEFRQAYDLNESMNYHRPQSAASSAMGDTLTTTLQREGLPVDNVDIQRQPVHSGKIDWEILDEYLLNYLGPNAAPKFHNCGLCRDSFLVSFLVDARGGAMRGCRHSGVRIIVPPKCAPSPTRITCKYVKPNKLTHPPPLMEGEGLASRVLQLMPVNIKFLGPVILEIPHFASICDNQREIVILRSEKGDIWQEHTLEANKDAIQQVLNQSFSGEELNQLEDLHTSRITRILTNDFPYYFALISRMKQDVQVIGPEGGTINSSTVANVHASFPQNALMKNIRVGLQAQFIDPVIATKLLGYSIAISPIATIEPRRRKFHKAITLSIPLPKAHPHSTVHSQYSANTPTLRLLCSITGGQNKAVWEDVTGSTPLNFQKQNVSFTTTVSARFWLMDTRNVHEVSRIATLLYNHEMAVPYMAKFVIFAKRVSLNEARIRVFCMTDDKEDKTLELHENFIEIAKSKDVEVMDGSSVYVDFSGNLIPILKMGEQSVLQFRAFQENRLAFTLKLKDPDDSIAGRIMFMKEPVAVKGETSQTLICILNLMLPEQITPDIGRSIPDLLYWDKELSFLKRTDLGFSSTIHRADLKLDDIGDQLNADWSRLAKELSVSQSDIDIIRKEYPNNTRQQAYIMLKLWLRQQANLANGNVLKKALHKIGRDDIVTKCVSNMKMVTNESEKALAQAHIDQAGFDALKDDLGVSRDKLDASSSETLDRLEEQAISRYHNGHGTKHLNDISPTPSPTPILDEVPPDNHNDVDLDKHSDENDMSSPKIPLKIQTIKKHSKKFIKPPSRPNIDDIHWESENNQNDEKSVSVSPPQSEQCVKRSKIPIILNQSSCNSSHEIGSDSDSDDSQHYAMHSTSRCLVKTLHSSSDISVGDNFSDDDDIEQSTAQTNHTKDVIEESDSKIPERKTIFLRKSEIEDIKRKFVKPVQREINMLCAQTSPNRTSSSSRSNRSDLKRNIAKINDNIATAATVTDKTSAIEIPHTKYDRLKAREYIRKKQLERKEKLLIEQKKNVDIEELKKKKLLDLKQKTQQLIQKNVRKNIGNSDSPKLAHCPEKDDFRNRIDDAIVEYNVVSEVQENYNGQQFSQVTNAAAKQCFHPNSVKISSTDPFNFMWAIKMKMSMNETPKMYQADHCNDYHNKATTRANNNLTNLIGQKTDLINNCDDGDSNGDDTSNNQNQSSLISSSCVNAAFQTLNKMIDEEDNKTGYLEKMLQIKECNLTKNFKHKLVTLEIEKKQMKESGKLDDMALIKRKQKRLVVKMRKSSAEISKLKKVQKTAAHQRKNFLIEQHDLMKLQFRRSSSLTAATAKNRNVSRRSPVRLAAVHSNGVGNADGDGDGDGDGDEIENNNLLTLLSDRDEITEQIETLHLEDEINQVLNDSELKAEIIEDIDELNTTRDYLMLKKSCSESSTSSISTVDVYESDFHEVNISWSIFVVIVVALVGTVVAAICNIDN